MEEHTRNDGTRKAPATVVNGTRVTVAFPFSKIELQEPSDDLRDLAVLVAELADAVAELAETEEAGELRDRAHQLRDRLSVAKHG